MNWDPRDIPRPKTPDDYAECYRANLREAKAYLQRALDSVRRLRKAGEIHNDAETKTVKCTSEAAVEAWGDYVRWNSDYEHWQTRLAQAEREAQGERKAPPTAPDPRLPVETDDDDLAPAPF